MDKAKTVVFLCFWRKELCSWRDCGSDKKNKNITFIRKCNKALSSYYQKKMLNSFLLARLFFMNWWPFPLVHHLALRPRRNPVNNWD